MLSQSGHFVRKYTTRTCEQHSSGRDLASISWAEEESLANVDEVQSFASNDEHDESEEDVCANDRCVARQF